MVLSPPQSSPIERAPFPEMQIESESFDFIKKKLLLFCFFVLNIREFISFYPLLFLSRFVLCGRTDIFMKINHANSQFNLHCKSRMADGTGSAKIEICESCPERKIIFKRNKEKKQSKEMVILETNEHTPHRQDKKGIETDREREIAERKVRTNQRDSFQKQSFQQVKNQKRFIFFPRSSFLSWSQLFIIPLLFSSSLSCL